MMSVDQANGVQQPVGRAALSADVVQETDANAAGQTRGRVGGDTGSRFALVMGLVFAIGLASAS